MCDTDSGIEPPSSADMDSQSESEGIIDGSVGGMPNTCRICFKQFDTRSLLNVHYTHTHRDKPLYECNFCGLVFNIKRELATHRRIHNGESLHVCTHCGKAFGTKQLLKKHHVWHTGRRDYVCSRCGKAFYQKGHLTQHMMIHTGGRPHLCELCGKTFIFKFDLNRHLKIHAERNEDSSFCPDDPVVTSQPLANFGQPNFGGGQTPGIGTSDSPGGHSHRNFDSPGPGTASERQNHSSMSENSPMSTSYRNIDAAAADLLKQIAGEKMTGAGNFEMDDSDSDENEMHFGECSTREMEEKDARMENSDTPIESTAESGFGIEDLTRSQSSAENLEASQIILQRILHAQGISGAIFDSANTTATTTIVPTTLTGPKKESESAATVNRNFILASLKSKCGASATAGSKPSTGQTSTVSIEAKQDLESKSASLFSEAAVTSSGLFQPDLAGGIWAKCLKAGFLQSQSSQNRADTSTAPLAFEDFVQCSSIQGQNREKPDVGIKTPGFGSLAGHGSPTVPIPTFLGKMSARHLVMSTTATCSRDAGNADEAKTGRPRDGEQQQGCCSCVSELSSARAELKSLRVASAKLRTRLAIREKELRNTRATVTAVHGLATNLLQACADFDSALMRNQVDACSQLLNLG